MSFLQDLALAHRKREGFFAPGQNPIFPKGTPSWRNNNPGNLRLTPYEMQAYGALPGDAGFARFPSYDVGLQALEDDLRAKICGQSSHIDYSKYPTFLTYVRVYAPTDDGNDPNGYCQFLCNQLSNYHISPQTQLVVLAKLIHADDEAALALRLKIAEEAQPRVTGLRKFALTRLIDRLRKIIGGVN